MEIVLASAAESDRESDNSQSQPLQVDPYGLRPGDRVVVDRRLECLPPDSPLAPPDNVRHIYERRAKETHLDPIIGQVAVSPVAQSNGNPPTSLIVQPDALNGEQPPPHVLPPNSTIAYLGNYLYAQYSDIHLQIGSSEQ